MTLTIAEALQQAQQAINGGDYRSAATTCAQLVNQFPAYASAHRLLGEAYREQGQAAEAERSFTAALGRHPRHPGAFLGLGLLAEDQGSSEAALAFCQVAWELAPNQLALREPLTRVSLRRYGSDGDLQLTHAALAHLHASAARLQRAADEYRLALAKLPERLDLRIGLVEVLWRLGEDSEAIEQARAIVEEYPECAPALVVLADLEHRGGNTKRADELLKRLRAVDPDGGIAASMAALNPRADRQYLAMPAAAMPVLNENIVVTMPDRPKLAPAPDLEYSPSRAETARPEIEPVAPIIADDLAPDLAAAPVSDAGQPVELSDFADLPDNLQPISIEELGGLPGELPASTAGEFNFDDLGAEAFAHGEDTQFDLEPLAPLTVDEVLQAEAPASELPAFELPSVEQPTMEPPAGQALESSQPFDDALLASMAPDPPSAPAAAGVDELQSLAAALEGDVADALHRAGEPVVPAADIDDNRPPDTRPRGYTSMLEGLDNQGHAPFDPLSRAPVDQPPMSLEDAVSQLDAGQSADAQAPVDEFGKITQEWDTIDAEIQAAMPDTIAHGYTEELRSIDASGLTPFEVDAAADEPAAAVSAFTPLPAEPAPAAESAPAEPEGAAGEDLLNGLQPFAFEEFDANQPAGAQPARSFFSQGGWESGGSAVPSDSDLDVLLAADDDEPDTIVDLDPSEVGTMALHPAGVQPLEEPRAEDIPAEMPAQPAPAAEFDPLASLPDLTSEELHEYLDSSIAVTRQLPGEIDYPIFEAAEPPVDDLADLELANSLKPGTELFMRARAVKEGLVSEGRIGGDRELGEGITTDELAAMHAALGTSELRPPVDDHDDYDDNDGHDLDTADLLASTGATRDTTTLRAALEVTPDDDELRWWLAEALRERGDVEDAYSEYRWLIRHAPHRHEQVIEALTGCVDNDRAPEMAHRLLGDIYRRRGDVTRASNHAALALQVRRRGGRVRA